MKVLFAVNDEKDAEAITRVYQKEYKEIISGKTVYYFNAIIKELQKDKTYDRIVISEDLEMFASDNYQAIDKFVFEKMDAISDEATNTEGNDIPIILLTMDRRTKNDPLLLKLFGLGIYNVLVGQDRSVQKVASLMYKPRTKKEAKAYYKVDSEDVGYSAGEKNNGVSETEIQNILNHYKKIGDNIPKCVQSFDSISSQYSKEQMKLIAQVLPNNVKVILEENSDTYRKLMGIKGRKLAGTSELRKVEYVEKEIETGSKLTQPVIIPTGVNTKNVNKVLSAEELKKKQADARKKAQEKAAKEKAEAEAKRKEEERIAKEKAEAEAKRKEEERIAKEKAEAEAKRREEERIAKEKAEAEAKRKEEERIAREKAEAEAKRKEEERIAREKAEAEAKRKEEERIAREKAEAEAKRKEEERIAREKAEAEAKRKEEERIAKEKAEAENKRREQEKMKKEKLEEQETVVKRGRGRPRKNAIEPVAAEDVPVKRKRGRPRKNSSDIELDEENKKVKDESVVKAKTVDNKKSENAIVDDDDDLLDFIEFDASEGSNIESDINSDIDDVEFDLFDEPDDVEDEETTLNNSEQEENLPEFEDYDEDGTETYDDDDEFDYDMLDDDDEVSEEEEDEALPGFEEDDEALPDFEDDDEDYDFVDDEVPEEDEDETLPGFEEDDEEDYDFVDDEVSEEDEDAALPGFEDDDEEDYDFLDDEVSEEEDDEALLGFEDDDEEDYDFVDDEVSEDDDEVLPGFEDDDEEDYDFVDDEVSEDDDEVLPGFEDDDEEDYDFADDEISEEDDETLPGLEDDDEDYDFIDDEVSEEDEALPGFEEDDDDEDDEALPDFEDDEDAEEDSDSSDIQYNGSFKGINNKNYRYDNNLANSIKDLRETDDNTSYNVDTDSLITSDQKVVSFVGTTKNGTSFIVNNLAELYSSKGIQTAILDLTKNKNAYYVYTNNEDELREKAHDCFEKLTTGIADGIKVNENLTVYTSLPGEDDGLDDVTSIIKTLLENYTIILLDCDFETDARYFKIAQEVYLVQSWDILTIQPLTAFLRELKVKNILETNKLRIIINKDIKVGSISEKALIGGMSSYSDPAMTYMTELFNRDTIRFISIPFDNQVYAKYLEGIANCQISSKGYSKSFMANMNKLSDMVYPVVSAKKTKNNYNDYSSQNNKQYDNTFSKDTNSILKKMKKKY